MKYLAMALIYIAFFSLIGAAVWFTGSAWCLWALVLTPSMTDRTDDE